MMINDVMYGSRWWQIHGWWSSGAYRGEISSAEWQCGLLRTAHNVCGLIISRVEVDVSPRYGASLLTTGGRTTWNGEASGVPGRASRILHDSWGELHIPFGSEKGDELHLGCGNWDAIPSPWWYILTIDKKIENKKYKADGGKMSYQNENTEKSIGNSQQIV